MKKPLENILGKGENDFLLFHNVFCRSKDRHHRFSNFEFIIFKDFQFCLWQNVVVCKEIIDYGVLKVTPEIII